MGLCDRCGGEVVQKSRWRLFAVGAILCAAPVLALFFSYFWLPGIVCALIGLYLIVWATLGRGLWCRQCKTFRI
jgi:hypothetical protein